VKGTHGRVAFAFLTVDRCWMLVALAAAASSSRVPVVGIESPFRGRLAYRPGDDNIRTGAAAAASASLAACKVAAAAAAAVAVAEVSLAMDATLAAQVDEVAAEVDEVAASAIEVNEVAAEENEVAATSTAASCAATAATTQVRRSSNATHATER
jgi:hypothetical protein